MRIPSFCSQTYDLQSLSVDSSRAVNVYVENKARGTAPVSDAYLFGTPGTQLFTTLPTGPVRALWGGDNRLFAVGGSNLYEISSGGGVSLTGAIGNSTDPAQIFSNGNELFIVAGDGFGYLANGISVTQVVPALSGAYIDGYFIAQLGTSSPANANQFNLSNIFDGSTWDPLLFGVKEGGPDRMQNMIADHEQLWLFGKKTIEIWDDTGDANFPFQRNPAGFIQQGLWAKFSLVQMDEKILWLGGDDRGIGQVWLAQGYLPKRVSTHAVEFAFRQYALAGLDTSDAVAYPYQEEGHSFYVLSFPTADATWVYDLTTDMWHERGSWDGTNFHQVFGRYHAWTFGNHFVGDYRNGNIYIQKLGIFTDNGAPIRRLRSAPHISDEKKRLFYSKLQLDQQAGPEVRHNTLRISNDGGFTFSAPWTIAPTRINQYLARTIWRRCGSARDRVFEISTTDPVEIAWIDSYVDVKPGSGT